MWKEFKDFAFKGNLIDLAIGVVMGAAFGKIVSAFIDGCIMPIVGILTSGQDFTKTRYILKDAVVENGKEVSAEVAIKYGAFLTEVLNFVIVAWVVFMVVKSVNRMRAATPPPPPAGPTADQVLLGEIRDLLKK